MSNQPELKIIHPGKHKRIIIFVHGLWGDPKTSFGSWPYLIRGDDEEVRGQLALSTYAVAILGYPAGSRDRLSLTEIQSNLLTELKNKGIFDDYEQIFFICHSLGGLVIKGLLIELKDSPEYFQKIKAIFLIATPSQGSPFANWISFLPKFIVESIFGRLVVDLQTKEVNTYLQYLESRWHKLFQQRENRYPRIYCAYEKKAIIIFKVVSKVHMTTDCDGDSEAITANHIDIVKPISPGAHIYTWVRGHIVDLQKELGPAVTKDEFVNIEIELEKLHKYLHKVCGKIQEVNEKCSSSLKNLSNKIDKTEQNELEETLQKWNELEKIACEWTQRSKAVELMKASRAERMEELDSLVDKENNIQ
jgi:hypothetical protein